MAISMNTNTTAMSSTLVMDKAHSKLSASHQNMGKGTKQLSAADSQIIGKMAREASGLKVGQTNIKKATSMLGIAQGAFQSVNDLLTQMKEKAFAATNVANGKSERAAYQEEFSSLGKQLERVFTNTTFNGEQLLAKGGKLDGQLVFQTGTQNSTPMKADFTEQLAKLMKGIDAPGTETKRSTAGNIAAATTIGEKYYLAMKDLVIAQNMAAAYKEALIVENVAKEAADKVIAAKNGVALAPGEVTEAMRSLYTSNADVGGANKLAKLEAATIKSGVDEVVIDTKGVIKADRTTVNTLALIHVANTDTVTALEALSLNAQHAVNTAQTAVNNVMDLKDFEHNGALNLRITDNVKSQEATVALEKLALSFDEMNSQVQALMDSMQAQSEMQATVINKTEEAIGATRDTDYMEETSNIAAAKLRNVTAMAAVKQSYEITSTIINTLVNVNN